MAEKLGAQKLTPRATPQKLSLALPEQTNAQQLQRSLSEFGANVAGITVRKHKEHVAKQTAKGEQAFELAEAEGRASAEQLEEDGIISRGQNPHFAKGVYNSLGRAKAEAYNNELRKAYAEMVDANTSIEDQDVEAVIEKVGALFSTEDDNEALKDGFAAPAAAAAQRLRAAHFGVVAKNLETAGDEALQMEFMGHLRRHTEFAGPNRVNEIASLVLMTQAQHREKVGRTMGTNDFRKMNQALVDSVELMLDEIGGTFTGEDAKELLNIIGTGKGPLMNIKGFNKQINAAIGRRSAREQAEMQRNQAMVLQAQAERQAQTMADFGVTGYSRRGLRELEREVQMAIEIDPFAYDAGFVQRAQRRQADVEAMSGREVEIVREVDDRLLLGIIGGEITTTQDDIIDEALDGNIPMSRADELIGKLAETQKQLREDPRRTGVRKETARQLHAILGGYTPSAMSEGSYLEARRHMYQAVESWVVRNPTLDETSDEYEAFLNPLMKRLMTRFMVDHAAVLGPISSAEEKHALRQFETVDMGLTRGELVDLVAQAQLVADDTVQYSADNNYYGFLTSGETPLSQKQATTTKTATRAIMGQINLTGIPFGELTDEINARREQLLTQAAMRGPKAAQAVEAGSLSTFFENQAAAMGLTAAEATALTKTADSLARVSTDPDGDGIVQ